MQGFWEIKLPVTVSEKQEFVFKPAFLLKKVSLVRTSTSIPKMISRKYKFHVRKRKVADFFEPSKILFGQIQC